MKPVAAPIVVVDDVLDLGDQIADAAARAGDRRGMGSLARGRSNQSALPM
jgi:hypothetical protein